MMPNVRFKTLQHHIYNLDDFNILKMASIYGANGSGKSNLIKSLGMLQKIILEEQVPYSLIKTCFKFQDKPEICPQTLAVEFIQENTAFYYAMEIKNGVISIEELYESGLGKKADKLIFERKTNTKLVSSIKFIDDFEKNQESKILKTILLEDFVKPNQPILKLLSKRENEYLQEVKKAFCWFDKSLQIITPNTKPSALAHFIDMDNEFKCYVEDMMRSFSLGIVSLHTEKQNITDVITNESEQVVDRFVKQLEESPNQIIGIRIGSEERILVKEDNDIFVKQLKIKHIGGDNINVDFDLEEESDGTVRLLDFIPVFKQASSSHKVFLIDEIERSIHSLLIKELVRKFALDKNSKGQLIFTTHESNLLDQEFFRQDEIWFMEKDQNGSTDLYSLSDFKEHKTIDIRRGYLSGRYGAIPFLANLHDLNWHRYDTSPK